MTNSRIAFFADVHSNLEALEACLDHARQQGAEKFVFLGDLVGYNANPNEVLERVMQLISLGHAIAIRGNHDTACFENYKDRMNPIAHLAIEWTMSKLSHEHIDFLKNLPLVLHEEDRCYVHASAYQPEAWHYVTDGLSAWRSAESSGKIYTFSGHVHEQALYYQSSVGKLICFTPHPGEAVPTGRHRRWVAIAGSVGQPRDNNPKANYLLFDAENECTYFHRVSYNHVLTADKIMSVGLPEDLSKRLLKGL
jgi:diadenosine tetraphosphatase ApaH/serine/threonine PP2A family protein phosphatase